MAEPLRTSPQVTRMYQGPKQEKQFRKQQRQLQQQELQNVYPLDKQEINLPAIIPSLPSADTKQASLANTLKPIPIDTNRPLVIIAYGWGLVGLGVNAWFALSQGKEPIDKAIFLFIGLFCEAGMFFLLARSSELWKGRCYGLSVVGVVFYVFCFVAVLTNSVGFASLNLAEVSTARAERITPEIGILKRKADGLKASKEAECVKRGPECRRLEGEEKQALDATLKAQGEAKATADPQTASAAKLVAWVTAGHFHPTADDFGMLRLLLLTLLPQLGGLVLMIAKQVRFEIPPSTSRRS